MPPESGMEEPMPGMPGEEGPEMDMGGEDEFATADAATSREMRESMIRESIYRGDRLMKILGTR